MRFKFSRSLLLVIVVLSFLPIADTSTFGGQGKEVHKKKDSVGREWVLKHWEEGTRPYPKDLRKREEWYRKKWGENWYGPPNGYRIHNSGNWKWEVVVTVPTHIAAKIASTGGERLWGRSFPLCFVWAPAGEAVTDIYASAGKGIYHYDPKNKKHSFIGQPKTGGIKDGKMGQALLVPGKGLTLDNITGRLYFVQQNDKNKRFLRYVEKLLPFECLLSKKVCYLPAVLDWNDLYLEVKSPFGGALRPVTKGGQRGAPVFVVRTHPGFKTFFMPGAYKGKRPLITPDAKGIYFSVKPAVGPDWRTLTLYSHTVFFDIETGKTGEKLKLLESPPRNYRSGPGDHGGNCMGYDGLIYTCQHGGATGGPGRMYSIDSDTGKVTMLYDSVASDGSWRKVRRKTRPMDGPADARSLIFTSTMWQVQCPRTGAVINGGWDRSGIRRYHDGFVTSIINSDYGKGIWPRPGWKDAPQFNHRNCDPSIAPNGDLYIADVHSDVPRILRIYRTDWPEEQPVNGYAERFVSKQRMKFLMLDYAREYIASYVEKDRILNNK